MMLDRMVLTHSGRRIVQSHRYSGDAQRVFRELDAEAMTSTQATLTGTDLLSRLTSVKYDGRGNKTSIAFITDFEGMLDRYNDQQPMEASRLNPLFAKVLLQNAVADVSMLLDVANQENQAVARGAPTFDFHQYLALLKSAAAHYDRRKFGGSRRDRSAHHTDITPNQDDKDISNEITDYLVHEIRRRMPGSTMNKATWDSLSKEGRTVWDTLSDGDKKKILQYAQDRAARPDIQANQHESNVNPDIPSVDDPPSPDALPTNDAPTSVDINNVIARARNDAHPGDARCMLGDTPKGRARKSDTRHVKFTSWEPPDDGDGYNSDDVDDIIEGYWDSSDDDDQDFHPGG